MENKFDKKKYDQQYHKDHYKRFLVDLKKEELAELEELLKKNNLTKAEFIRKSIEILKKCK